jgi:hypothetical protein
MDLELIGFLIIVFLSVIGFILKYMEETDILIITSNILFILYGGIMALTK